MYCRAPFIKDGFPFPCGKCFPCKMSKRRTWAHRILLESYCYQDNAFVTLTYEDEFMPRNEKGRGILLPSDPQQFLKTFRERLRRANPDFRIRFFCVGEYGDDTWRPHYHLALFNYKPCPNIVYDHVKKKWMAPRVDEKHPCCEQCNLIWSCWKKGFIQNAQLDLGSAEYISRYTVKKMTSNQDIRLGGRPPEFARMSLKPGLGTDFMWEVASSLMATNAIGEEDDVPTRLRHGTRTYPLGRYLRRKLREYMGRDPNTPDFIMEEIFETLRPLQAEAEERLKEHKVDSPGSGKKYAEFYREVILEQKEQLVRDMEARSKIFNHRGSL